MLTESTVVTQFQSTLTSFKFQNPQCFAEEFAQTRYKKKMEVPDKSATQRLTLECQDIWFETDQALPRTLVKPHKLWYVARKFLHDNLRKPRLTEFDFPKGSEFVPTYGHNSIEARLCESTWTCTEDCFDMFCEIAYNHRALKTAVRHRYTNWFNKQTVSFNQNSFDKFLYRELSCPFEIFKWKVKQIVRIVEGSRFSTVYKNREKRRPINIEPFCNLVVQRAIGLWLRGEIKRLFGIDLDTQATWHRHRIQLWSLIATLDLKNASDSVSLALCEFALPSIVLRTLMHARSPATLVNGYEWYLPFKMSSMGNGFTFELMTLLLLALCRCVDSTSSVFGDDIIVEKQYAPIVVEALENVGFVVNTDKSFIDGPFYESCGANFHKDFGYIESYDFEYPENIGDCVILWNKCIRLGALYPSFKLLRDTLYRLIPKALRGGPNEHFRKANYAELRVFWDNQVDETALSIPDFFVTPKAEGLPPKGAEKLEKIILTLYPKAKISYGLGYKSVMRNRSKTVRDLNPRHHWAKYMFYLYSNSVTNDVITGSGRWEPFYYITVNGLRMRYSAAKKHYTEAVQLRPTPVNRRVVKLVARKGHYDRVSLLNCEVK